MASERNDLIDHSRYFHNTCQDASPLTSWSPHCLQTARDLLLRSQSVLGDKEALASGSLGSLYSGSLAAFVFLEWKMALAFRRHSPTTDKIDESQHMLERALCQSQRACAYQIQKQTRQHGGKKRNNRVTLLESPFVGAKAMEAVLLHSLERHKAAHDSAHELILWLLKNATKLSPNECEVLYGRAGAIHAILFLRQELNDEKLGTDLVVLLAQEILEQGKKVSNLFSHLGFPLLWRWHDKFYFGSAHGIAGILQALLSLNQAEREQLDREHAMLLLIRQTIDRMNSKHCFPSGNLASSIKEVDHGRWQIGRDRLVHFCHGCVGHTLLLAQAAEVLKNHQYRLLARANAQRVIWPRGLLKKGVGLCHGISGNSYAFLVLASLEEDEQVSSNLVSCARSFAEFALNHLPSLESVPDRPYSLYEGIGGLCALLLDVNNPTRDTNISFPLYTFKF